MPELTAQMQEEINKAVADLRATADESNKKLEAAQAGLAETTEKLTKAEELFTAKSEEVDKLSAAINQQKRMDEIADEYGREPDAFCAKHNRRHNLALYANEPGTNGRGFTTPEYLALEKLKRSMMLAVMQRPSRIPKADEIMATAIPVEDRQLLEAAMKEPHLAAVININTDDQGGLGVPDPVVAMVEMEADVDSKIAGMVQHRRINKPTEEIKMNIWGGAVRSLSENATGDDGIEDNLDSSIRYGSLHIRLQKFGAAWRETEEFKQFVQNNAGEMAFRRYAIEMRKLREKHILLGTGTGVAADTEPRGLLTSTTAKRAITEVDVDAAPDDHWNKPREFKTGYAGLWPHDGAGRDTAANRALTMNLLIEMKEWMRDEYADGAVWLMNRREYAKLVQMRDGDGNYLLFRNFNMAGATYDEILGHKVVKSDYMPKKADDAYSVAFLNPSEAYILADLDGIRITRESITRPDTERTYIRQFWGGNVGWGAAAHLLKFAD